MGLVGLPISAQIYVSNDVAPQLPRDVLDGDFYSLVGGCMQGGVPGA